MTLTDKQRDNFLRDEKIVLRYDKQHRPIRVIAEEFGLSVERVRQILVREGVGTHYRKWKSGEHETAVREAHERLILGVSDVKQEADALGISASSLRTYFVRYELPPVTRRKELPDHGTRHRYVTYKCRCDECRAANRRYMTSLKEQEPKEHGTVSAYKNYGCRCIPCRRANALHLRERKAREAKTRNRRDPNRS